MYGIVEVGGHQYQVGPGKLIDVDKLEAQVGEEVVFNKVLFIGADASTHQIGAPYLEGASVKAKVVRHLRGPKLTVFRRKPGAFYRKNGHRQEYTCLFITEVKDAQGKAIQVDAQSERAQKYLNAPAA